MKTFNALLAASLLTALLFISLVVRADDQKKTEKLIPYPLKTCIVSGDKLGGDMGAPIVFVYQDPAKGINQEIKFCCASCKPDFLKNPDKYLKLIHEAAAKAKAKGAKN